MIWGREKEQKELLSLLDKKTSSLVVVTGRRRIGKSSLIQYFAKNNIQLFYEFSGLAPHEKQTNQDQLNHFAQQLSAQTQTPGFYFKDWNEAFTALNSQIQKSKKSILILFDEISWMGAHDSDFPGKLKVLWDTKFKLNSKLILVLCGSVTTWIQHNILNRADFVGRVSLEIDLKEFPLSVVHNFWGAHFQRISPREKIKILLVTGAVPRYLEEIRPKVSAEQEIARLCFQETGFLFNEFEKIFNEIFQKKAKLYRSLVQALVEKHISAVEISKKVKRAQNKDLSEALEALELSGFIEREYVYLPSGVKTKVSRYRVKDNFLRFYLKYIEPRRDQIKQLRYPIKTIDHLSQWDTIVGYQFENLVLNHLPEILNQLNIEPSTILSASPYSQRKKTRNKGACQIDLLIVCKHKTLYVCEIKFRKLIDGSVIKDMNHKIKIMENSRKYSIRPVLIYSGELEKNSEGELKEYFDKLISIESLIG